MTFDRDVLLGAVPRLASPGAAPNNTPLDAVSQPLTTRTEPSTALVRSAEEAASSGGAGGVPPWAGSSPPPLEPPVRKRGRPRIWTREAVLAEVARFVETRGRKPTSTEWLCARPRDGSPWVAVAIVQREFGSWNAMLEAARLPFEAPGTYVRTPESIARSSASQTRVQRERHGHARDYGRLVPSCLAISESQRDALKLLNGGLSEHVRRAIDLYLLARPWDDQRSAGA